MIAVSRNRTCRLIAAEAHYRCARMRQVRALRLANPFVRAVLGSPAHPLLSGRLLVLSYRGHRTTRSFRIPVQYATTGDGTIVALAVHPERKLWWRSFVASAGARLTLRGEQVDVRGALVDGVEREAALAAYVERHPRSARLAQDAAIVVFTPMPR